MSQPYSQDIRFGNSAGHNNPRAIYLDYKPSRIITTNGPPEITDGEFEWYAINTLAGILYKKTPETNGQWQEIYEFPGGTGSGDITNGYNVGGGVEVFLDKTGTLLNFRTLVSEIPFGSQEVAIVIDQDEDIINLTVNRSINNAINSGASGASLIDDIVFDFNNKGTLQLKSIKAGSGINVSDINSEIIISSTGSPVTMDYYSAILNVPFPVLGIPINSNNVIFNIPPVSLIVNSLPFGGWSDSGVNNEIYLYTGINGLKYSATIDITSYTSQQSGAGVPIIHQYFIRERDSLGNLISDHPGSFVTVMFAGTNEPVTTYATGSSTFIIEPVNSHTYAVTLVVRTSSPVFSSRSYTIEKLNVTFLQI